MSNNLINIPKLINNSSNDRIIELLPTWISKLVDYCQEIIGEGGHGRIIRPNYGSDMKVTIKNKEINIKTVMKMFKQIGQIRNIPIYDQKMYLHNLEEWKLNHKDYDKLRKIKVPDNLTILYGDYNPLYEVVTLSYLSKLWYDGISPHMPYMVAALHCNHENLIDTLVLETAGLLEPINIIQRTHSIGIYENIAKHSYLENCMELALYICNNYEKKKNKFFVKLPNDNVVDVIQFIDSLTLSFIFCYEHVHRELGLILTDQSAQNVFLHWLRTDSHMGETNISNLQNIFYELDNQVYKIDTHGIVLKIGDTGSSILKVKHDLTIIIDVNYEAAFQKSVYLDRIACYVHFISHFHSLFPREISKHTIMDQILENEFPEYSLMTGVYLDQATASDVLKKYFKGFIYKGKIEKSNNMFHVKA